MPRAIEGNRLWLAEKEWRKLRNFLPRLKKATVATSPGLDEAGIHLWDKVTRHLSDRSLAKVPKDEMTCVEVTQDECRWIEMFADLHGLKAGPL